SISFKDVFQNGHAPTKHMIVRFPEEDGPWYILRCEKHNLNFKKHPIKGAATHLGSKKHSRMSRAPAVAIGHLGIEVFDCDETLAERNNLVALEAFEKGYKHAVANPEDGQRESNRIPDSLHTTPARQTPGIRSRTCKDLRSGGSSQQATDLEAITEPIPGEIYLAYWEKATDWYPALLLPLGKCDNVGVPDTIESLELTDDVPACYMYHQGTETLMW
ncbi:hypothetical protein EDB80DRAFT_528033, partial [Ilyonectria destructans]